MSDLNYDGIEFPVREKDFSRIETKSNICINVLCHENQLTFPIYISDQEFEKSMDLLLVIDESKSHYLYIKSCERFVFHITKKKKQKILLQKLFTVL